MNFTYKSSTLTLCTMRVYAKSNWVLNDNVELCFRCTIPVKSLYCCKVAQFKKNFYYVLLLKILIIEETDTFTFTIWDKRSTQKFVEHRRHRLPLQVANKHQ